MLRSWIIANALLLLAREPNAAAEDVDVSGTIAAGYEVDDNPEPEAEAEVELETERHGGLRGVIQVEGRYFQGHVFVEDAYLDHKISERLRLQLGVNKKRLGLEYEQGRRERLTPERSLVYQRLEELGIVGRQLNLRVLTEPREDLEVDVTAGTGGNRDVNALVHVGGRAGNLGLGVWGLVELRRVDHGYMTIWASAASMWIHTPRYRAELELLSGIEPVETELERLVGASRRVRFVGSKAEVAVRLPVSSALVIEPLVQSSAIARDAGDLGASTLQLLGGVNLRHGRAVLALAIDVVSESGRAPQGLRFHGQARLHF